MPKKQQAKKKKLSTSQKKKSKPSPKSIKEEIWRLTNGGTSAESEVETKVPISEQLARRCNLPSCRKKCCCVSESESSNPSESEISDSGSASASIPDSASEENGFQSKGALSSAAFQEFQKLQQQEQKQQNNHKSQTKSSSNFAQNGQQTQTTFPVNYDSDAYYDNVAAVANNNNYSNGGSDDNYQYYSESDTSDFSGGGGFGGGGGHSRNCQCQQCGNSGSSGDLCCYSSCSPALKAVFVVLFIVLTIGCIGLATTPAGPPPAVYYYQ